MTSLEDYHGWREAEETRMFGPAEERAARNQAYVQGLIDKHGEPLLREILLTLAQQPDFIPARVLSRSDLQYTPLAELFRKESFTYFYLERVRGGKRRLRVDVAHGSGGTAGSGETFVFQRRPNGLELVERYDRWIS